MCHAHASGVLEMMSGVARLQELHVVQKPTTFFRPSVPVLQAARSQIIGTRRLVEGYLVTGSWHHGMSRNDNEHNFLEHRSQSISPRHLLAQSVT